MFKKRFFIMASVIIVIIGGAIAVFAKGKQSSAPTKRHTAKLLSNGPWEDILTNDEGKIHLIQEVHNGNEIYYSIPNNDPNTNLFHKEIKAWNDLGVIKLIQVPWKNKKSEIVLRSVNHYLNNPQIEDGYNIDGHYDYKNITFATTTNTNAKPNLSVKPNGIMHGGTVTLFKSFFELPDKEQQVNAVRHEIGHALGFAHDNRTVKIGWENFHLTMYPNLSDSVHLYNKLGGIEQRTLATHYNIKPKDGYLKTNY